MPRLPEHPGPAPAVGGVLRVLGSPYLLLTLNMLLWAGNWIAGRAIREHLAPVELAFWRWLLAFALLAPFTAGRLWSRRAVLREHWAILLVLGALGIGAFNTLIYLSLQTTTAVNGALITSSQPVAIVLVSWLLFRDRVTARQGVGIAISLVGVLLIITRGDPRPLLGLRFTAGDLWALAAVPVWALYSVLLRLRPAGLNALELLTALIGVGVLCLLPPFVLLGRAGAAVFGDPAALAAIGYVAVFASVTGYVLWTTGITRIGPNVAGQFIYLVPPFTAVLAFALLGEALRPYHLAGIVLIFAGIRLVTAGQARRAAAAARASGK